MVEQAPTVCGIPFLRSGRDELRAAVEALLAEGDERGAAIALLADQDDWAPTPPPSPEDCARVYDDPSLSLREAMALLSYGPVADYFAHRWSDPTFLSLLALLGCHGSARARTALEVGCGIGHGLRELHHRGVDVAGTDVVWSKLFLAQRYLVPDATLVCADAGTSALPFADGAFDVAYAHDVLYFVTPHAAKQRVVAELARCGGAVLVGHCHNALVENHSAGAPLDPAGWAALLGEAGLEPLRLYDDLELTAALLEDRHPVPVAQPSDLDDAAAVALAARTADPTDPGPLGLPQAGTTLRLNPLYAGGMDDEGCLRLELEWPSDRYRDEYAPLSGYLTDPHTVDADVVHAAERGELFTDPRVDAIVRRRVVLDLPERW